MNSDIRLLGFSMNKDIHTRVCKKSEFYNELNDLIKTHYSEPLYIIEKISTPTGRSIVVEVKRKIDSFLKKYEF